MRQLEKYLDESAAVVDVKMVMDIPRDVIPRHEIESKLKKYLSDFEDEIAKLLGGKIHWGVSVH